MSTDAPGAVMGATTTVKTMADGTLRLAIDIDPRFAQTAFALFGAPGTSVAVAKLDPAAAVAVDQKPVEPVKEQPKGGALAKLAGQWCNDHTFWEWLEEEVGRKVASAEDAAGLVRHICMVASRAELDNDAAAADRFHRLVRRPYADWLEWRRTS